MCGGYPAALDFKPGRSFVLVKGKTFRKTSNHQINVKYTLTSAFGIFQINITVKLIYKRKQWISRRALRQNAKTAT